MFKRFWKFIVTDDRTGKPSKTAFIQFSTFMIITAFVLFVTTLVTLDVFGIVDAVSDASFKMIEEVFKYMFEIFIVTTAGYNTNRFIKAKWGSIEAKPIKNPKGDEDDYEDEEDHERVEI